MEEPSDEEWAAIRALCEGALPTFRRVAAAAGQPVSRIVKRSHREGWEKLDCRDPAVRHARARGMAAADADAMAREAAPANGSRGSDPLGTANLPPLDRVERVMDVLLREVERIGAAAGNGGRALDKARIDGVWAMIRTLEKVEEFARERAGETAATRENEMADMLGLIDARIEELARAYAEEIVARRDGVGAGEGMSSEGEGSGGEGDLAHRRRRLPDIGQPDERRRSVAGTSS